MRNLPGKLRDAVNKIPTLICFPLLKALLTHTWIEDKNTKTIFVAKGKIYYNLEFVEKAEPEELSDIIFIEGVRILLAHPYRINQPNPQKAYMSSLITLGELIRPKLSGKSGGQGTERLTLPTAREVFKSDEHDTKNLEYYYNLLFGKDDIGEEQDFAVNQNSENLQEYLKEGFEKAGQWQQDNVMKNVCEIISNEANAYKCWGIEVGNIQQLFELSRKSDIDYIDLLRRFKTSIISNDRIQTRMKPSRRYGYLQVGCRVDMHSNLLIALDVSGSVSDDDINIALGSMRRIFQTGITKLDFICWDTVIHGEPQEIKKNTTKFNIEGRGGTDVQCVIDFMNNTQSYDGVIIITDGCFAEPTKVNFNKVMFLLNNKENYEATHQTLEKYGVCSYIK